MRQWQCRDCAAGEDSPCIVPYDPSEPMAPVVCPCGNEQDCKWKLVEVASPAEERPDTVALAGIRIDLNEALNLKHDSDLRDAIRAIASALPSGTQQRKRSITDLSHTVDINDGLYQ